MVASDFQYDQAYVNTGHGQPVILLNGLFGNAHIWKPAVNALKDNFRVIVPRLPLMDFPVEHLNVRLAAYSLHEFIEYHQLQNVILVGHAVGGQLALMYTYLFPANIRKLVLISSGGLMERASSDIEANNYVQFLSEIDQTPSLKEQDDTSFRETGFGAMEDITGISRQFRISAFLNKIDHPVLLVWGLQDPISPPESALHFNDLLCNSEIRFLDNCGHVPMVEKPAEFAEHLLNFIRPQHGKSWYA